MNGLSERHRQARGMPPPETSSGLSRSTAEIFPSNSTGYHGLYDTDGEGESLDPNDDDDGDFIGAPVPRVNSFLPPTTPATDGTLWPCLYCPSDNETGYICPYPIPVPLNALPGAQRPERFDARASLLSPDMTEFRR